jgi:hypothetical protein
LAGRSAGAAVDRRPTRRRPAPAAAVGVRRGGRGSSMSAQFSGSSHRPNGPGDASPGLRRKPMPWEEKAINHRGLKGRESFCRSRALSVQVLAALQAAGSVGAFGPRASACGLSPGLGSPGPLGRTIRPRLRAAGISFSLGGQSRK